MQQETTSSSSLSSSRSQHTQRKSKIIRYNTACINPITLDVESVDDEKHLHNWAASLMNRVDLMHMGRRGSVKQEQHIYK
ncbi:unnamed protein product [Schistosoma margrebowiei]|uniref:Uncharacterized protein n=1 Tax=Schistosoma margrebowiei TaxID=48269 RepID=A0A183LPB9_9TREM|nr:unnamed protein product [Schistosoma margrebowiei]